ncbi:MAG: bifunctional phosphopantothenoylcysteine decarboxylase/phosphopantothenate--cysteine ligase CoaBC [Candidatus Eisenbacteria bacterium]
MGARVILGVTGSIAAYKSAELVRLLTKSGLEVQVVMTRSATEFLAPLTLATLSGLPVTVDMFGPPEGMAPAYGDDTATGNDRVAASPTGGAASNIEHIRASRAAALLVVAPATANVLGKIAHGIADDALTTTILASSIPVLFAPAMNTWMWENAAVRANVRLLRERGYRFLDPGVGDLACGEYGAGRMADPEQIADVVIRETWGTRPAAPTLLVTAGGTEEPLDPVRCLTNRSSGRMGIAIAEAARNRGYRVTLIAARTSVPLPFGVERVHVSTAAEMAQAVARLHRAHDLLVMAAAVADYRPERAERRKIGSGQPTWSLPLVETTDILESIRGQRADAVTVGFALQVGGSAARQRDAAREKLQRKGLDLIVLNDPTRTGSEFGGTSNEVTLIGPSEEVRLPQMGKDEVALRILERAESLRKEKQRRETQGTETQGTEKRGTKTPRRRPQESAPRTRKKATTTRGGKGRS